MFQDNQQMTISLLFQIGRTVLIIFLMVVLITTRRPVIILTNCCESLTWMPELTLYMLDNKYNYPLMLYSRIAFRVRS